MIKRPGARRREEAEAKTRLERIASPRNFVFLILISVLGIGGGRRWLQAIRARRAISRLHESDVTADEVEAVGAFGRAGAYDLFRLLSDAPREEIRAAAGRALCRIWAADDLVAEEEQAIVRRLFKVDWQARRTYPRSLSRTIPITLSYGIGGDDGPKALRGLQRSHRITGTGRASSEVESQWHYGEGHATVEIDPRDFPTDGPHRLVLHARMRTAPAGWQIDLPRMPFSFEFDRRLQVDALLTHLDESRREAMHGSVKLRPPGDEPDHGDPPQLLSLVNDLVLRDPPVVGVAGGRPHDLAHRVEVEIEGVEGRYAAGELVAPSGAARVFEIREVRGVPSGAIDRPGEVRMRVHLVADADLGWTHPAIRSIWPGTIVTNWEAARILRR